MCRLSERMGTRQRLEFHDPRCIEELTEQLVVCSRVIVSTASVVSRGVMVRMSWSCHWFIKSFRLLEASVATMGGEMISYKEITRVRVLKSQ